MSDKMRLEVLLEGSGGTYSEPDTLYGYEALEQGRVTKEELIDLLVSDVRKWWPGLNDADVRLIVSFLTHKLGVSDR